MLYPPLPRHPPFTAIKPYPVKLLPPAPRALLPQVDLRPTINSLGLSVRDQGGRNTCSVFAMTFLLEYTYDTRLNRGFTDLSEEYLNDVCNLVSGDTGDGDYFSHLDNGYQAWGIVPEASEPYQMITEVTSIPQSLLEAGRRWAPLRRRGTRASQTGSGGDGGRFSTASPRRGAEWRPFRAMTINWTSSSSGPTELSGRLLGTPTPLRGGGEGGGESSREGGPLSCVLCPAHNEAMGVGNPS